MALIRNIRKLIDANEFPYSVKSFQNFNQLNLDNDMTILVGDNGTGKSTLLEIIATKLNLYRISEDLNYNDPEFKEIKKAVKGFDIEYSVKPRGFFFRSEDFITYTKYLERAKNEAKEEIKRINEEYKHKSKFSSSLARMPHMRTIGDIESMYSKTLHEESHGEAYLDFFKSRLKPNSLYILDEAEMPLSFNSQLVLMLLFKEAISMGCQFIIATHSPVLMSYPNASIYNVSENGFVRTSYDELEAVESLRDFLNNKDLHLNKLFNQT